ncbi:conserved hypothetical protein [Desulforapulum autotrophicum HRM2]|uniref:DUF1611 domain-containing protein n=1 Tax=Desulforapulum autotrophicum (strain ATCC 43914 / DSM 3382 / VKM B-1955 / HRM2) TaxID=177437 RepID=C0QM05_DESAH|nr:DUF1611 domain-containing protein [Desulforapulum autotrophicum]ACN14311.1 conserved hypothetical protein [Desulforapulum autotrophicum HRM2]
MKSEVNNDKTNTGLDKKKQPMMGSAVILTNGRLDTIDAKTAHGLIRGTERFEITGVIDANSAGQDAGMLVDGTHRNLPIYADMDTYLAAGGKRPDFAIIGLALCGGRLDEQWQALALDMINRGISIVNGMHMLLGDIPVFKKAARDNHVQIIDIRRPKPFDQLSYWSGRIFDMKVPRLAVLGTDCALGKRTTARLIIEACRRQGTTAEMIYTGQTGWLQGSPHGFILDTTTNDFVSGEIESAIVQCEQTSCPDLIVVEGQSAMRNPLGPCGAEIIVSGNIKGVILQHAPFRELYDSAENLGCLLPELESEIKLIEMFGTKVIAIVLNGTGGSDSALKSWGQRIGKSTGIPVVCPMLESMDKLLPLIRQFIQDHDLLPDTTARKPRAASQTDNTHD